MPLGVCGVSIGNGAVIGANTVVTKNIDDYAIAVGNPARIIKKRFDENIIERLLKIQWWDWNDQIIEKFLPVMLSQDIQKFLALAENFLAN